MRRRVVGVAFAAQTLPSMSPVEVVRPSIEHPSQMQLPLTPAVVDVGDAPAAAHGATGGRSHRSSRARRPSDDLAALVAQLEAEPEVRAQLAALLGAVVARTCHTTASLAAELGTSERTIRRAIAAGELVASRRAGRWVMTVEDVRDWLDRGRGSSAAPRRRSPGAGVRRGTMAAALDRL